MGTQQHRLLLSGYGLILSVARWYRPEKTCLPTNTAASSVEKSSRRSSPFPMTRPRNARAVEPARRKTSPRCSAPSVSPSRAVASTRTIMARRARQPDRARVAHPVRQTRSPTRRRAARRVTRQGLRPPHRRLRRLRLLRATNAERQSPRLRSMREQAWLRRPCLLRA